MVPTPQQRLVQVGGVELSCRIWPGTGRPLLTLHGLASNARWWDLVAQALSPPHLVVAPDLRGHGLSEKPAHGYGFAEVGQDLIELIASLDLAEPVVVGHSWGASLALWLAAELPDVRGVVCVDGGVADLREIFGSDWEQAREAMRPPRTANLDEATLRRFLAGSGLADEVGEAAAISALLGNFEVGPDGWLTPRLDLDRHMEIAEALYHLDLESLWARVSCPVLYLLADDGSARSAPKRVRAEHAVASSRGAAEAIFLPGHHDLPVQHPKRVALEVARFIARLEGQQQRRMTGPT
jgi:pimeloyl-ACP methyl ester carboxylesterase